MLEYEDENYEDSASYNMYEGNLAFNAEIKIMIIRYIKLRDLDRDQILGYKEFPEDFDSRFLESITVGERKFILDLFDRYPELSDKKMAQKYILEGEYSPLL